MRDDIRPNTRRKTVVSAPASIAPPKPTKTQPKSPTTPLGSEIAHMLSSTVGRASMLLGAAAGTFFASVAIYALATWAGIVVNYYIVLIALIMGGIVGLLTEMIIGLIKTRSV